MALAFSPSRCAAVPRLLSAIGLADPVAELHPDLQRALEADQRLALGLLPVEVDEAEVVLHPRLADQVPRGLRGAERGQVRGGPVGQVAPGVEEPEHRRGELPGQLAEAELGGLEHRGHEVGPLALAPVEPVVVVREAHRRAGRPPIPSTGTALDCGESTRCASAALGVYQPIRRSTACARAVSSSSICARSAA
jgi:hypothetical protein